MVPRLLNNLKNRLAGKKDNSLVFLNIAQFFGSINDNIFKLVLVYLLIQILGAEKSGIILPAVGAVYVVPFLLFSSSAGIFADRFSKQKLLVVMKVAEIIIMCLAIFAFGFRLIWASYLLLFLLSTHSALFGPSKYGIIPELVNKDAVSKSNGLITSFTYLAIIVGTFLASFLTELTQHRFAWVAAFCLLLAFIGFASALNIKTTRAQGSDKKITPFFIREIYYTLRTCRGEKHLLASIFGSAYFLFIGAFTQLNIIPFAISSLHLTEVAGGYLFLATAVGIAIGAFIAGKVSKKQIELGLSCFAIISIALIFFCISFSSGHLAVTIFFLALLGMFGGMFIVPFDSFMQLHSAHDRRGQVIAASNFCGFFGVLVASWFLYFFSEILGLSPGQGFAAIGVITAVVALLFVGRLTDLTLSFVGKKLYRWMHVEEEDLKLISKKNPSLIILENRSLTKLCLLQVAIPHIHFFVPHVPLWLKPFLHSITPISNETLPEDIPPLLKRQDTLACLAIKGAFIPSKSHSSRLSQVALIHIHSIDKGHKISCRILRLM